MIPPDASVCPACGRRAPTIVRSTGAYCTACGEERQPFGSTVVNVAGKPSRLGGAVAKVAGWTAVAVGLAAGTFLYAMAAWIFPGSPLPFLGVLVGLVGVVVGALLLLGGSKLRRAGEGAEQSARRSAIRALAAHRGGTVTAHDVASAIGLDEQEADRLLTSLAKDPEAGVSLELDDAGSVYYVFQGAARRRFEMPRPNVRVALGDEEPSLTGELEDAADHASRPLHR